MTRLFWKFFAIIWVTLAGTVAAIMVTVNFSQTEPFARELEQQRREMVLNLTVALLRNDGEDAARRFVTASEQTLPLGLAISTIANSGPCPETHTGATRVILEDGICYRASVSEQDNLFLNYLGMVMPWLAILVSSAIAAALLAQYLIRPVVNLRDGLSALAHGRFDVRIGDQMAGRKDEVTALAHDFDSTAARLQELQAAQQRLFHDVSHELRSPLSRLQAVVGVLRQSPAKLGAMLDRMDREVERLDVLVGEVLTLARLTSGTSLPLRTQTVDVLELLNEVLGDAEFEARTREVSITPSVDGAFLGEVEGELIYRALENVVRNAVKYTAERSKVTVRCETKDDLLTIRVADQGPGVGRDELERIFQPFSRGDDAEQREGYGLGLAITRQAIERHGGRVSASLADTGGLAITIELPRKSSM
ncbi:MAG: HAMP domain-containing protein [Mesorhizobium sp.]|uniref:HAMP domain-containing sensor histidine kinase n=1 Tax=Mesorhizobium sp. TaxID=1871066 RepID=UPI000FE500F7|nr:ATP-binding protein [Mesorhizobium sp.]RWI57070.1 MAG: HAMP domain-containing protein [Mesorhizobium sp.]